DGLRFRVSAEARPNRSADAQPVLVEQHAAGGVETDLDRLALLRQLAADGRVGTNDLAVAKVDLVDRAAAQIGGRDHPAGQPVSRRRTDRKFLRANHDRDRLTGAERPWGNDRDRLAD